MYPTGIYGVCYLRMREADPQRLQTYLTACLSGLPLSALVVKRRRTTLSQDKPAGLLGSYSK